VPEESLPESAVVLVSGTVVAPFLEAFVEPAPEAGFRPFFRRVNRSRTEVEDWFGSVSFERGAAAFSAGFSEDVSAGTPADVPPDGTFEISDLLPESLLSAGVETVGKLGATDASPEASDFGRSAVGALTGSRRAGDWLDVCEVPFVSVVVAAGGSADCAGALKSPEAEAVAAAPIFSSRPSSVPFTFLYRA
jgi:hypothetical protein